ncbi:unnamed protein product [Protopolystoma xenopodis]|uniref:Uncharacterized protein n=1 Tax=Protopolystoma xenopodis TaxID=117903 RepID=A0A448WJ88_9PLAT|nr:unnamed protein product [Protopolystoma xenopodis]
MWYIPRRFAAVVVKEMSFNMVLQMTKVNDDADMMPAKRLGMFHVHAPILHCRGLTPAEGVDKTNARSKLKSTLDENNFWKSKDLILAFHTELDPLLGMTGTALTIPPFGPLVSNVCETEAPPPPAPETVVIGTVTNISTSAGVTIPISNILAGPTGASIGDTATLAPETNLIAPSPGSFTSNTEKLNPFNETPAELSELAQVGHF